MAAETLARAGLSVTLAEAKPTLGRKFLMAGKSGLNLTKSEPPELFERAYGDRADHLAPMLARFGPDQVQDWARDLGQDLFTGSTGRVFPKVMKASPLLRAWAGRIVGAGVSVQMRWRWTGFAGHNAVFDTPEGQQEIAADVVVLALGGASWARLGSDGAWAEHFPDSSAPFQPANAGIIVDWSDKMAAQFGAPVKSVALKAGGQGSRGEVGVSAKGIEGGGIYALTPALRNGAPLTMDLMPDMEPRAVAEKLARRRRGDSLSSHLRRALKLSPVKRALLMEFGRPLPDDLAPVIKDLPLRYAGIMPMDQAISTAGGLRFDALDDGLMLRDRPGVFVAGEMLDWEAPTGGYLLTGCLATGLWAGERAADYALSGA
jgi:uncharacterized flavoprotein (TIGR03862 family)